MSAGSGGAGADQESHAPVRAMILAAGLGTRMRPLSDLRAKPALPVRGRPLVSLLLALLARHGIRDVMINLHHLPGTIREAVAGDRPPAIRVHWSEEPAPLGTGGALRRAAGFLRTGSECVVLAGDMLLDLDLTALLARHRRQGRDATLVLREDPRGEHFGTIGIDGEGRVTRIGARAVARTGGGAAEEPRDETGAGLFTGVRIFSRRLLSEWPEDVAFEDLRDWLVPAIEARACVVGGELLPADQCVWEPVGTPAEYLRANLSPPDLPSLGGSPERWSGAVRMIGADRDVLLEPHAILGEGARLASTVVWRDERVPPGLEARGGVFAAGRFHACPGPDAGDAA